MASVLDLSDRDSQAIQERCRQIADGLQAAGGCPRCSVPLEAKISLEAVEVSCPSGCFRFSYRRDLVTGAFVSGSLELVNQDTTRLPSPIPGISGSPLTGIPGSPRAT